MTPQEHLKRIHDQLQKAADAKARERREADKNALSSQIGQYLSAVIQPLKEAVNEMKRVAANVGVLSSKMDSFEIPKPEINVDLSSFNFPTPNITVKPIV